MVQQPAFRQIFREWSRQVKLQENPTTFANMYLDWMRDPGDYELRAACSMFISFTRTLSWGELLTVIGPKLQEDVLEDFKMPFAEEFYEGFRDMLIEQIRAYWEDFTLSQKARHSLVQDLGPKEWSPIGEYKLKLKQE